MKLAYRMSVTSLVISLVTCLTIFAAPSAEENHTKTYDAIAKVIKNDAPSQGTTVDIDTIESIGTLAEPTTLEQKFSYAYSYLLYLSTIQQNVDLDSDYYAKGALDAANSQCLYTKAELTEIIQEMQKKLLLEAQTEYNKIAKENLEESQKFLAQNKKKPGVISSDSGFQYKVEQGGSGSSPVDGQNVKISYKISDLDNNIIDQSDGEKIFAMDSLSSLLSEALKIMKIGSEYLFYVPSSLIGDLGEVSSFEPNQLLLIDVKLSAIVK